MEGIITGALAGALEAGRERYNAQFTYARHLNPRLDASVFSEHLRACVYPAVESAAKLFPEKTKEVTDALFLLSLELLGKDFLGAKPRYPSVANAWKRFVTELPELLAAEPRRFSGLVFNALYNLSVVPGARMEAWVETMLRLGKTGCSLDAFLEAGKIAAWRCGMAHYRTGALEACTKLKPEVVRDAMGVQENGSEVTAEEMMKTAMSDPWRHPLSPISKAHCQRELRVTARAGGFRGFGGFFIQPPEVIFSDGVFYAFDGETCWSLHADVFGSTLVRFGKTLPDIKTGGSSKNFSVDKKGRVTKEKISAGFPELAEALSFASNETTLAVTVPLSHYVHLVALVEV